MVRWPCTADGFVGADGVEHVPVGRYLLSDIDTGGELVSVEAEKPRLSEWPANSSAS